MPYADSSGVGAARAKHHVTGTRTRSMSAAHLLPNKKKKKRSRAEIGSLVARGEEETRAKKRHERSIFYVVT